ncbi:MAG: ABC transporter ATP-binding protein [Parvularculaceae bacterium]
MRRALEFDRAAVAVDGRTILSEICFAAAGGEFIGLVGPNGAGKSTLLRAAAGLAPLAVGARFLGGAPHDDLSPVARARRLAYLPQARPIYWALPAGEIVALGRFAYGGFGRLSAEDNAAVARALKEAGAEAFRDRAAVSLSGGELARVHLARALAAEAPLLLADEPIAALDPAHQLSVMQVLKSRAQNGAAVIAALHDLTLAARYCTRIILLQNGRIHADGPPEETLTEKTVKTVFGVTAHITREEAGIAMTIFPLEGKPPA